MLDNEKYGVLSDEQIILKIHNGDDLAQDFLIDRYKQFVKVKTRLYFIIGADKEDILQEGMIGLYKAIRDYKLDKGVLFCAFAEMCVMRQIITAIKAATRKKHIPLNTYISLNKSVFDDGSPNTYIDLFMEARMNSPEELLISREEKDYIETHIGTALSTLERRALSLYLQGKSYVEIGYTLSKDEKSVDNALQRVRRKVGKILLEKNLTPPRKYARI